MRTAFFQDLHSPLPMDDLNLRFDDYITQCRTRITQRRLDLNSPLAEQIINANTPFELRPTQSIQCGALLIHGLLDSPFTMRDMGLQLQAQGVLCRSILLPGHGTVPGDLLHVNYQEWLQAVRYGIASFAKEVDQLYLIGYSTGASLALYHGLQAKDNIAGIVMLAPALKINSPLAGIANGYKLLSWAWPRAAWLTQDANESRDYTRYTSITLNAVHQVHQLARAIQKEKPCSLPLLFVIAQHDDTVCSRASLDYFQKQTHPKNHLLLYGNTPIAIDPRITQRRSDYPLLRIRDFSHLALPISQQNLHYGENGDCPLASRVMTEDDTIYGEFGPLQIRLNEALVKLKLSRYHYKRLTFNPDFDFLMKAVRRFLGTEK